MPRNTVRTDQGLFLYSGLESNGVAIQLDPAAPLADTAGQWPQRVMPGPRSLPPRRRWWSGNFWPGGNSVHISPVSLRACPAIHGCLRISVRRRAQRVRHDNLDGIGRARTSVAHRMSARGLVGRQLFGIPSCRVADLSSLQVGKNEQDWSGECRQPRGAGHGGRNARADPAQAPTQGAPGRCGGSTRSTRIDRCATRGGAPPGPADRAPAQAQRRPPLSARPASGGAGQRDEYSNGRSL